MKIRIICVGKLKEDYLKYGVNEYVKRLGRFAITEIIEVADNKIPDKASESECEIIKNIEGERILKKISDNDYVISLCIEGKQISSTSFAEKMNRIFLSGKNTVDFIIGGSLGLSDKVKNKSDFLLSFSKFTFPHQLMRLILAEQIYRTFKINANEEYHK